MELLPARDVFTLLELGEGQFVLSRKPSRLAGQGDKVADILDEAGVSLEKVLQTLDEERTQ